jgi:trans-aconitate methyltransferase
MLTPEYQEQLKNLHNSSKAFGNKAVIPEDIALLIEKYQVSSILDFGCGKGHMVLALKEKYPNITVCGFDPGMESFDALPKNVDMIFSFDVLEHIEPELLDQTLVDLAQRTNKVMYHLIACHPAKKSLSDGRNAHLIVETPEWWKQKLQTVLNWKMYNDSIVVYTSVKGNPSTPQGVQFDVVKFLVTLEKV